MQARNNTSWPGRRPLIAALTTLASCGAWADEPSPWYLGVSQAFTHDSNVYRLSEGVADPDGQGRGDNYSSTGLLGGFDQAIGRQRLYATANVKYHKYQDHDKLDNTSYGLNAGWDWSTIEKFSGNFNLAANQALASYDGNSTRQTTERNLLKTDQVSASVRWGGAGRLGLTGAYAHSRVSYSAPEFLGSKSSADTGSIGATYSVNPDLRVGAAVRLTRSVEPFGAQTQANPPVYESNTTNGRNLDLFVDWQASAKTGVNARLSWTRQTNSGGSARDFSGLTGALSARYAPTAKLGFTASYNRDAGTNGSFFNIAAQPGAAPVVGLYENSRTTDSLRLGANYAATAKISANAYYEHRRAKIVNTVAGGAGSAPLGEYTDRLNRASLGVTWAIARAWSLGCSVSHEKRDVSSTPVYAYTANVASCSAQFMLR